MNTPPTSRNETESSYLEESAESLRQRLTNAEADALQLMQQLEEMGFGGKMNNEGSISNLILSNSDNNLYLPNSENQNVSYSNHLSHAQTSVPDSCGKLQQSLTASHTSKNSKHRPVPFNFLGGSFAILESNMATGIVPKLPSSLESGPSKQDMSEVLVQEVGQQVQGSELLQVKQLVAQLQEQVQHEMEGKQKAKEEAQKLQILLQEVHTTKAELEMKVEELNLGKQKLNRRMMELKEEASRESSLRSSLEESHTTLLSRLQDMESVIESLRMECRTQSTKSSNLIAEVARLKDELAKEISNKHKMEENFCSLNTEKEKLLLNANQTHAENQRVFQELTTLQVQYADLIRQLEQTQTLVDSLVTGKKTAEEDRSCLQARVQVLTQDLDHLKVVHKETKESEAKLTAENSAIGKDLIQQKAEKEKLMKDNLEKNHKIDGLDQELKTLRQNLTKKNAEFASAADGLEFELVEIKNQLEAMEREKQKVLKDKESLIEEVNRTVDALMSERSRLQTELQTNSAETESLKVTCSRLQQDKAQLLENLEDIKQKQATHQRIEVTLNEMMTQKNKMAYENGRLLSTIDQLQLDLAEANREQADIFQLKKLCESLQAKYTKSQQVISEQKISLQKQEVQTRIAVEELERKQQQIKMVQERGDNTEMEAQKLKAQLEVVRGRQQHKNERYEKNMEAAKNVNKEITGTLEAVMNSHTQLQNVVENIQVELGKRDSQIGQLKICRKKEQEEMKLEIKKYEDKIETLKQELKKEQEKTGKKKVKEHSEILKQNENLSSRNQDLMKANSELRQKLVEVGKEKDEIKRKLLGQRHKLQYLHKAKKQLEENLNKMKSVHEDIEELEQMREEYMQKNKEQGETIGRFINQVATLQEEVRQLVAVHSKTQNLHKQKEEALEKERKIQDEIRERYKECKKREEDLGKKSQSSDEKLKEVHSESLEISKHLEEAHDWFKGKFDKLQLELTTSREIQAKLELENMDQRKYLEQEKCKSQNAMERAKEMIQNSRQTISQLADYAKMAEKDTKKPSTQNQGGVQLPLWTSKLTMMDLET